MRDLAVGVHKGLLIHTANALQSTDVEGVLGAQVARMSGFYFTGDLVIQLFPFQRLNLRFGQHDAFLSNFFFQRFQPVFEVSQAVAQPNTANAAGRYEDAQFAQFVGSACLPMSWFINRVLQNGFFYRRIGSIFQIGFAPVCFQQRFDATFFHGILVAIEGVSR